ncbi:ribonuclease II-like protein, partial [Angomonas deanei]
MTRYEDKQGEVAVDDFDIEEKTPMSKVLADGRRIQNVKLTTDDKTVERKLSQDVRLRNAIGAPPYEQVQFPEGKSPHGAVVRVLWRRFNPYQIGRIADGVVRPGQQNLYNNYFYRFKLYNPKLPQVCVEGKDIPSMFHSTISQHFFLLKFESDPNGYLKIYKGDMSLAIIQYSLGNTMSVDTNNLIIQQSYGIPSDVYPADAEACVPETFAFPTEEEMKKTGRRDLRSEEFVCTIDPETARDLDDALSIRKTKKGTYKVGVHIADVSHFVKPGTALDEEAQQRSTSVYFVDKVVPMLPRRLCEDYCSLNPSEDKLAFSSLFELSEDGTVLEEWFGQSIIRSRCRLSYEQAQEIIDTGATPIDVTRECELSGEGEATLKEKVFKSVQLLYQVASVLRKKSLAKGRLTVPNTRLGFQFEEQDSKLAPKAFFVKSQIHANWLVEEFMLLANCRTAEKVVQYSRRDDAPPTAPPEKKKLTVLKQSLKECGIILIGGDAKGLQDTLDSAKGHPCYEALSQLLKYSLCRAEYFANDLLETTFRSHFALGFPWYCHFTSPIRRYTDVVSHRQLLLGPGGGETNEG